MKKILLFLYTSLLFVQCSSVPITGRKRINFVSDAQVLPTSFAQYKTFLAENKLATDSKRTAELKAVGHKISKSVDTFMRANNMKKEAASYEWEFNLIEEESLNAWCMPGGKVVFLYRNFTHRKKHGWHCCHHGARNRTRFCKARPRTNVFCTNTTLGQYSGQYRHPKQRRKRKRIVESRLWSRFSIGNAQI